MLALRIFFKCRGQGFESLTIISLKRFIVRNSIFHRCSCRDAVIILQRSSVLFLRIKSILVHFKRRKKRNTPRSGFGPESKPRQGFMIGHYTTRAYNEIFFKKGKYIPFFNFFFVEMVFFIKKFKLDVFYRISSNKSYSSIAP